ncbi:MULTISPECIES: type VI secretion system accessory protein TagJ [unclassified Serratia (in: enterobacteria)]|uniref:type VI secretion system accessory protein TagJ n=1 Tax=unclassified Serratia (in: enterobacteria) TaxID=2647522 RepID=UPI002ED4CCAB|nr:type VI secretion system accessory protein TagJ [Serratia sp. C2(2)]MEE4448015.1 type VI secretion system accessory protein TagJ [Serratia sp. C2(1)]
MQDLTFLTQALKTSSLDDIFAQVLAQVKERPQDLKAREVLFKLYGIQGQWDKALLQLQTLALLDEGAQKRIELYKNLVFSEMQRMQVLTGERQAATLQGDTPQWMEKLQQANAEHYAGKAEEARISRQDAFELAPESAGKSDTLGEFSWIADSDSRLGPVCEFICAGGYRWLPFASLQQLSVTKPGDLLDLLWVPSTIKVAGDVYYGFIPARYPVNQGDSQDCKLGLKTEWATLSDILFAGSGRKVLTTNLSEQSIMEVGDIAFG